jgi:hypothetical protein
VVTINGLKQSFLVLRNDRKTPGSKQPDYALVSGEDPRADDYTRRRAADTNDGGGRGDDDIPF